MTDSATPIRPANGRRQFLNQTAALAVGALGAPAVFAADETIKIGHLTHRTGPFAPFAEADSFISSAKATASLASPR